MCEVIFNTCCNVVFLRWCHGNSAVNDPMMCDGYERLPSYLDTLPDPPGGLPPPFDLVRDFLEECEGDTTMMLLDSNV